MSHEEELRKKRKAPALKVGLGGRLQSMGQGEGKVAAADWGDVHEGHVLGIILEITRRGGAASFGLSRDKAVFNLTLFLDGERQTTWIKAGLGAEEELEALLHQVAALPD